MALDTEGFTVIFAMRKSKKKKSQSLFRKTLGDQMQYVLH
ncbi:MAG: hypothetical protein TRG1_3555 [Flavobacteriaceae bacterium FS1-H7996/R]|nr:MAG: hypothetical protein TRG1_3555 [Flavobacteriaceae bacterium FS1-H7996/R]